MTTLPRFIATLVTGGTLVVALAACGQPGTPDASSPAGSPSPGPSASASASPDPSSSDSPGASASPSAPSMPSEAPAQPGAALTLGCLDLVSLDTMYQFDPNFGLQAEYAPIPGSNGQTAIDSGGIACSWVQQTSGETIEIAAARPSTATLDELRASAGVAAGSNTHFSSTNGSGTVQSFNGPSWVSATSTYFLSAMDAQLLIDSATAALD